MQHYLASLTILLLVGMVVIQVTRMKKHGISAMLFGKIDKKDFLIPPFAFLYFYQIFAGAFNMPSISEHQFFDSEIVSWIGVSLCLTGLVIFFLSIVAFGSSFRVGIDVNNPDKLVTTGVFGITRNPIYVAFWIIFFGQFLVFPNWILLLYLGAVTLLFHRQVLFEETFLEEYYGQEYSKYRDRVKRYV